MESEARNEFNNHYNEFFYATMCHVCKRFDDGVSLMRCSKCKMISYCGKDHQTQHWKQHKPLCKAIQAVLQNYNMDDRGETTEEWTEKKLMFMDLVSYKLGRGLNVSEMDMVCLPRECLVCHKRKSLESCLKCATNFCKNHKNGIEHRYICAPLELCLRTDLFSIREGNNPPDLQPYLQNFLQQYSHVSCKSTFENMKDFIKAFRNIQTDSEMSRNLRAVLNSEYLTHSLTLFYALQLLNDVPKSKELVVHVLGARTSEEITLIGWEILPRLIGTAMPVTIIMIGPELSCKLKPSHDCDNCMSREKKCLTFEFHGVLYENYVRNNPSFVKPDLFVTFNPCIDKHKFRFSEETWAPSIKFIAKQNCPFILTSPTLRSFKKDIDRLNTILDKEVDHLYSGKNPFSSLIPYRTIGTEYVSYMSQYVVIYRSLSS